MHNGNGSVAEVLSCLNEQMSVIPFAIATGWSYIPIKFHPGFRPFPTTL